MEKNDFINFQNVSFTYPIIEGDLDENGKQIVPSCIFDDFSVVFPQGFSSIIGPNASGKSTFMLLAAGRLACQSGKITLFGKEIASLPEEKKNLVATMLYQNMEFESCAAVKDILGQVLQNGNYKGKNKELLNGCIQNFFLENLLDKELDHLSKGEMQRVLLAFCILYGSNSVFMDEPFFAMEDAQKHAALAFLKEYSKTQNISFLISMHEIDLTRKYADNVMLLFPNSKQKKYITGKTQDVLTQQNLEEAYSTPYSMLRHGETLTRKQLQEFWKH